MNTLVRKHFRWRRLPLRWRPVRLLRQAFHEDYSLHMYHATLCRLVIDPIYRNEGMRLTQ